MHKNVTYYRKNDHIECVCYMDSTQSYPMHTHTGHMMLGYITGGIVCVVCGGCARRYHTSEYFWIMPTSRMRLRQ